MNISTRYTVALHILTLLATSDDEPLTSEYIASSVNTNAVVIRRILAYLRKGGLANSVPGHNGGWRLSRAPETISLREVRCVMDEGSPFSMHAQMPNQACPVGRNIQRLLSARFDDAEKAMETELSRTTISDLVAGVHE